MQKTMIQIDLSESSLFLFSVQERGWPGFYLMILPLKLIFSEGADPNILGFFFLESYDLREAISTGFVCDHKSLLCAWPQSHFLPLWLASSFVAIEGLRIGDFTRFTAIWKNALLDNLEQETNFRKFEQLICSFLETWKSR